NQPAAELRSDMPDHQMLSTRSPAPREQHAPAPRQPAQQVHDTVRHQPTHAHDAGRMQPAATETAESASALQQSIARIHEACQAPPLSPPEYRALFDVMAKEIESNGLTGARTLVNICDRAR